jgi:hypothetical protein
MVILMPAQIRGKKSRMYSDLRTIATALEFYNVDEGTYPAPNWERNPSWYHVYEALTTPVAYLTGVPRDLFASSKTTGPAQYGYGAGLEGLGYAWREWPAPNVYPCDVYLLESVGLDGARQNANGRLATHLYPWPDIDATDEEELMSMIYDPTNGTFSSGQIYRSGGQFIDRPPIDVWLKSVNR